MTQKIHLAIAIAIALVTVAAQGTVSLPLGVPPAWGEYIVSWSNFDLKIYAVVAPVLIAYGLLPSLPSPSGAVKAMILVALVATMGIASPRRALAAGESPEAFNLHVKNSAAAVPVNDLFAGLAQPFQDLANFLASDFVAAAALSTAIPGLTDGNGHDCWVTMGSAGAILKAHPIPLTLRGATDLEAIRLFNAEANKVCQTTQCTQVFTELTNGVKTLAPVGASIPIPSFTDICAKVPTVAMVAPQIQDQAAPAPSLIPSPAK